MTYRIVVRPLAALDVTEAYEWYEGQQSALGISFLDALETSLNSIAAGPSRYPIAVRDVKRCLVSRFPYSIYFRVRDAEPEVHIIGVLHQHRDPAIVMRRLRGKSR